MSEGKPIVVDADLTRKVLHTLPEAQTDLATVWAKEVTTYHAPTEAQKTAHAQLAFAAQAFICTILRNCPPCADRTDAIRKVREAKMVASAAVALDGLV